LCQGCKEKGEVTLALVVVFFIFGTSFNIPRCPQKTFIHFRKNIFICFNHTAYKSFYILFVGKVNTFSFQLNAEEFDFIISNIESFILNPTRIYKDKEGKTGNICFYKETKEGAYFSILDTTGNSVYLVSAYRLSAIEEKRKNYLAGYKLIWSWKVDLPSS